MNLLAMMSVLSLAGWQAPLQNTPTTLTPPRLLHAYFYYAPGAIEPTLRDEDPFEHFAPQMLNASWVVVRAQTDTAGEADSNERISAARARSLAARLRTAGVTSPILIQACGERVLNKPTADGVSEPLNRFATFEWGVDGEPATLSQCPTTHYTD